MKRAAEFAIGLLLLMATTAFAASGNYGVRTGDTLHIEVLEDTSLNRSVLVLPDGRISFPFAGTLPARGRTTAQIERSLQKAIAEQFQSPPTVVVSVTSVAPALGPAPEAGSDLLQVYVMGEVTAPGLKEVAPGTTFMQLLAQSGGFTKFAATKRIQLRRRDPKTGAERVHKINYRALANGAALRNDQILQPGDVILVPERRLFE